MLFVGLLNAALPKGQRAVLVGGSLVQFYSAGSYESKDIDLVSDRAALAKVLVPAGFLEDTRGFEDRARGLLVDVSTKGLRESEEMIELEFEGLRVPVVSLEDAIVDRLLGAKYWKSDLDWEQARLLYLAQRERIRPTILRDRARRNDVEDLARRLLEE